MTLVRARPVPVAATVAVALVISSCTSEQEGSGAPGATSSSQGSTTGPSAPTAQESAVLTQQGVNAGHPLAADAGMQMLNQGGNAVDAAIAASFAVSVVEPYASGIGGGGSALVADADGTTGAFDYREVVAQDGRIPASNTGIPGFVAGMAQLHQQRGSLDWAELVRPAVEMADNGVPVTGTLVQRIAAGGGAATSGLEQFWPGGAALQVGDQLVQTDLADSLRTLQREGAEGFYAGSLADAVSAVDGLDRGSLEAYTVQQSVPPQGQVGDYQVVSSSPALPGAALIRLLQDLDAGGISEVDPDSAEHVRRVSQAWVDAEQTVQTQLGDPDFVDVDVEGILRPVSEEEGPQAAEGPDSADSADSATVALGDGDVADSQNMLTPGNTTHLTVVDGDGTVVSMTNTLTEFWGSGTEVGGFFLNDQLSRFSTVNSANNQPEPGRRSVTWSNPTMVLDDQGRPVLGIGTPGGANILSILANALSRWVLQGQSLAEAVVAPRFRLDAGSGTLLVEPGMMDTPVGSQLSGLGWPVQTSAEGLFGSVQALQVNYDDGTVTGPTDTRLEAGTLISDVR
ncbi:gamma-glutamyltransferase [Corynebacterium glyciniphilum]|uniref:gamma-glutamyltransferase n=1 Tax=Corynebacterium glyciniphilum TaxID=1404244 RepID=UPI003DA1AC72